MNHRIASALVLWFSFSTPSDRVPARQSPAPEPAGAGETFKTRLAADALEAARADDFATFTARLEALADQPGPSDGLLADLTEALADSDPDVRWAAAAILARMGTKAEEAAGALAARLDDSDFLVRTMAAAALGRIGTPAEKAVAGLVEFLDDEMPDYAGEKGLRSVMLLAGDRDEPRKAAIETLARIGKPALPGLLTAMRREQHRIREGAVRAIGAMGPKAREALPEVEGLLADGVPAVRVYAAIALWQIDGRAELAVPVLIAGLANEDPLVQDRAAECLGQIGPQASQAVPALAALLEPGAPQGANLASIARALGRIGPAAQDAAGGLKRLLSQEDSWVRLRAAEAWWRTTNDAGAALSVLTALLEAEHPVVRHSAAEILGDFGARARPAVEALLKAARDESAYVREAVRAALRRIDPTATLREDAPVE